MSPTRPVYHTRTGPVGSLALNKANRHREGKADAAKHKVTSNR